MSWVNTYLKLAEARFQTAKANVQDSLERIPLEVQQAVNDAQRRLAGAQLRVAETAERGRTAPEVALAGLGETGSMVGDVLNMPLEALGVNELVGQATEAALSTPTGQAAMQKVQEVQQAYPRASENVGNLFGALNIIPGMQAPSVATRATNKLLRNVDTMVEGGPLKKVETALASPTLEKPLQKVGLPNLGKQAEGLFNFYGPLQPLSFLGESLQAIPATVREVFSPEAIANERAKGVSQRRVDEITGPESKKGDLDVGSAYAGQNLYRQMGREVDETMISVLPITARNTRITVPDWDEQALRREMFEELDAVPLEVQDRVLNHVRVVHNADNGNTSVVVREPQTQGFTKEGKGLSGRGSPAIRTLTSEKTMGTYAKALGKTIDTLSAEDLTDIVKASFMMTNDRLKRDLRRNFPELSTEKGLKQQETILRYLRGRVRQNRGGGVQPTAAEKKLLDFLDNSFEEFGGKVTIDGDFVYLSQGYRSEMKDLGGVNQFIAIDTKNKDVYTLISDRHDLAGKDPIGGSGLVTVGTMDKVNLGGGFDEGIDALKKERRQERVQQREKEAVAKTEEMTGIKINKGESPVNYSKRVLRDSKFTPEARDYLESLYRGSWAITAATETDNER